MKRKVDKQRKQQAREAVKREKAAGNIPQSVPDNIDCLLAVRDYDGNCAYYHKGEYCTVPNPEKPLTIASLGWTKEKAARVRAEFGVFADGWDDPEMDIYNEM